MTYTAYDRTNALGTYATSKDLKTFTKHPVIAPQFTYREFKKLLDCSSDLNQKYLFHYKVFKEHGLGDDRVDKLLAWDKNFMFFPRKINGKFALPRLDPSGIQIVFFNDPAELDRGSGTVPDGPEEPHRDESFLYTSPATSAAAHRRLRPRMVGC